MNTTQLLNALSQHQGHERGISAVDLARKIGFTDADGTRKLRKLVSELREQGFAICAKPETGYYVPVTPEELQQSCEFLEHRALHSLRLLSRMRGVALPELLGQLKLNQA